MSWRIVVLVLIACLCSIHVEAQRTGVIARDRTLLELDAAALYVRSGATISLDSALLLNSGRLDISRLSVIGEGFDSVFCQRYGGWIHHGNVDSFIRLLPRLGGTDQSKAKWLIGAWYAFQPRASAYNKAVEWLTQAREAAGRSGDLQLGTQSECLLSKAYYMQGDTINGNRCFFAIVNNPALSRWPSLQAKAYKYLGIYGPFIPQMAKLRLDGLTKAFRQYQLLGDTGNQVNLLMDIAYQRFAGGDAKGSQEAALESLNLQNAWHFPHSQFTADLLSYLSEFSGNDAGSLKYALAALKALEITDDRYSKPPVYERIAHAYNKLNDKAAASEWYRRALQVALEQHNAQVIYRVLENAAAGKPIDLDLNLSKLDMLRELLRKEPPSAPIDLQMANMALGNCYIELHDYAAAERFYLTAYKLDEQLPLTKGGLKNAYLLERLSSIAVQRKEYTASRKYLLLLLSPVYANTMEKHVLYHTYEDMHRVDSAFGNFRSAYHYLTLAKRLSEKIFTEAQTQQMQDLNVKYQTLQREKLLQISEAKRQSEAQKEANTRKLFYGGFALLGILISMIYIRYYNNKQKNRQLREQKKEINMQYELLHEFSDKQQVLLTEKEWLLREIHHRVKNNLQIIASLLSAQSEFLNDRTALKAMADSQHRVKAMALIHQKLYNSQNLSTIDMAEYVGDLALYLRDSHDPERKVIFNLDIEKVRLDVTKAVPIGLILNEAITNAFKYAFTEGQVARISIRLTKTGQLIGLEVSDNGRGIAQGIDLSNGHSFGMILMRGMAEDLAGNFAITNGQGTTIAVSFIDAIADVLI